MSDDLLEIQDVIIEIKNLFAVKHIVIADALITIQSLQSFCKDQLLIRLNAFLIQFPQIVQNQAVKQYDVYLFFYAASHDQDSEYNEIIKKYFGMSDLERDRIISGVEEKIRTENCDLDISSDLNLSSCKDLPIVQEIKQEQCKISQIKSQIMKLSTQILDKKQEITNTSLISQQKQLQINQMQQNQQAIQQRINQQQILQTSLSDPKHPQQRSQMNDQLYTQEMKFLNELEDVNKLQIQQLGKQICENGKQICNNIQQLNEDLKMKLQQELQQKITDSNESLRQSVEKLNQFQQQNELQQSKYFNLSQNEQIQLQLQSKMQQQLSQSQSEINLGQTIKHLNENIIDISQSVCQLSKQQNNDVNQLIEQISQGFKAFNDKIGEMQQKSQQQRSKMSQFEVFGIVTIILMVVAKIVMIMRVK